MQQATAPLLVGAAKSDPTSAAAPAKTGKAVVASAVAAGAAETTAHKSATTVPATAGVLSGRVGRKAGRVDEDGGDHHLKGTTLHRAAATGDVQRMSAVLLSAGVRGKGKILDSGDHRRWTALHVAAAVS